MTGDGAWSLDTQACWLKPGLLRRGGCRNGARKGPDTNGVRFVLLLHDMGLSNPWHLTKSRHHLSQRMAHKEALKWYEQPCNNCGKKGVHKKCDAFSISYHKKWRHTCIPASQQPNPTPIPNRSIPPTPRPALLGLLPLPLSTRPLPSPMFWDPKEEHPTKGMRRVPAHNAPLLYVRTLWARSARGYIVFLKRRSARGADPPPPPPCAPPKGFETYINSALKTAWFGLGRAPLAIVAGN